MPRKAPIVSKRRRIGASEFKARCLQLLEHVRHSGEELEITKRGEPIAVLVPVRPIRAELFGLLRGRMVITGDIVNVDTTEDWEAAR